MSEKNTKYIIARESDGRWIAEIPGVPGAMAYGGTVAEAKAKAYAIANDDQRAYRADAESRRKLCELISKRYP